MNEVSNSPSQPSILLYELYQCTCQPLKLPFSKIIASDGNRKRFELRCSGDGSLSLPVYVNKRGFQRLGSKPKPPYLGIRTPKFIDIRQRHASSPF